MDSKIGAIWARVSTDKQTETSIPTQINLSKNKAESMGYTIPASYILATEQTSMDLNEDPKFMELYDLITKHKITALFLLDRDRLQAEPIERLSFISLCKEHNVQIYPAQGPDLIDSDEGQLIEMVLAIGKKKSVLRAQMGSKQGLHDRAIRDRLPVTYHKIYGYQWNKITKSLVPDDNWINVKLIFDLLSDGKGYDFVIKELQSRGILSPAGQLIWNKAAISNIVHNPVYAGRYYALKQEAVVPKKRRTDKRGKTSMANRPESEWIPIPEIKIEEPPITWERRQRILDQISSHMRIAQRHAEHDYLLRGFIYCNEHYGKNGRPRVYHGHPKSDREGNIYYYCCPVSGCKNRYLPGKAMEDYIKLKIAQVLVTQPDDFYKQIKNENYTEKSIKNRLDQLSKKTMQITNKQARLEDDRYSEKISIAVYNQLRDKYEFEISGIKNQTDELLEQLNQIRQKDTALESFKALQDKYAQVLNAVIFEMLPEKDTLYDDDLFPRGKVQEKHLSNEQWREIFTTLDLKIMTNPVKPGNKVGKFDPGKDISISIGLKVYEIPKLHDKINGLVSPWEGKRNNYYPLILNNDILGELHNKSNHSLYQKIGT